MADKEKMLQSADMLDAFAACREVGAVVGVHAELGAVIAENEKRLAARGVTGNSTFASPNEHHTDQIKKCNIEYANLLQFNG